MKIYITAILILASTLSVSKLTLSANESAWIPTYHFSPQQGWMNDPNGFSYFDDYYHIFYQYNPDAPIWGLMHWGHARSTDMLSWEHLPIALTPSLPEDIDGIFSGSAVVNENNLTLIYTGVSGNYSHQMQCLATSSDGLNFDKEGVVLRKDDDDKDFRDPKILWQNGSWFVVIGSKTSDNKGEVLLYKSSDLRNWEPQGVLAQADDKLGYMWESPDFFELGDKQILIVSPQGMEQDGYDYQNLYQTGYFVGNWTPGGEYKIERGFREIDHGHDFYAPQTMLVPDGRRILIAWLDMWDSVFPESAEGWSGMLTLPRELTLSLSGDLEVRPIREIFDRREYFTMKESKFALNSSLIIDGNVFSKEVIIEFDLLQTTSNIFGISIGADDLDSDEGVKLFINSTEGRLFLNRYYPQYNIEATSRSIPVNLNGSLSLDIFVDGSSVEVFVNDGQAVLSSRIYPNDDQRSIILFMDAGTLVIGNYMGFDIVLDPDLE